MASFQTRLLAAQRAGDLTVADMARWFGIPFSTSKYWCSVDNPNLAPRGPRARIIGKRLKQLEWAIEHEIGFPVPEMLTARDRPRHIERVLHLVDARVPLSHFT